MNLSKKQAGSYFSLAAAIVMIVSIILHRSVMHPYAYTTVFLWIAVVCGVLGFLLSDKVAGPLMPVAASIYVSLAAVYGISLMVNQIGYVISGLDDMSTIMGTIQFEIAAVIALILSILASFLPMAKQED